MCIPGIHCLVYGPSRSTGSNTPWLHGVTDRWTPVSQLHSADARRHNVTALRRCQKSDAVSGAICLCEARRERLVNCGQEFMPKGKDFYLVTLSQLLQEVPAALPCLRDSRAGLPLASHGVAAMGALGHVGS